MSSKKNAQAVATPTQAEIMRAHPEYPGNLEFLARELGSSVKRGREELINSLEWLARNLTAEAESLKANSDRSPDTCIMSSSLVHTITQLASATYEREKALASLQCALQRDTEHGRFVPHASKVVTAEEPKPAVEAMANK